jgi:hypothetical protein
MGQYVRKHWDSAGNLVIDQADERPMPVIGPAQLQQAKQTLRSMVGTFSANGVPTGTPTNAQLRNWLLALTVATRYLANELDNET